VIFCTIHFKNLYFSILRLYRLQVTHYNSEASAITTNAVLDKNGKEISHTTREAII